MRMTVDQFTEGRSVIPWSFINSPVILGPFIFSRIIVLIEPAL